MLQRKGWWLADCGTVENRDLECDEHEPRKTGYWEKRDGRIDENLLGVSEMKWTGMGHVKSDNHEVYYCGQDAQRRNGVAFICTDEIRRCVMGFNPVSDRIAIIRRLQCKPVNMTALQVLEINNSMSLYCQRLHSIICIGFIHSDCCIVCCHLPDNRKPCIENRSV